MCGQHAYQAPAPRPVCALDNESKARPAAQAQQTRSQDNENKESQLPRVEKTTIEAAPSLSAAPNKRAKLACARPRACLCSFEQ